MVHDVACLLMCPWVIWRKGYWNPSPVFNWVVLFYWVVSVLYIFLIQRPHQINAFSYSRHCLLAFLMVSFETWKFLHWIKFNLSIFFPFVAHAFHVIPKNPLPNPRPCRLTLLFSPKNCRLLALTFRSLIHFLNSFLHMLWGSFTLLHVNINIYWKGHLFPIEFSWHQIWYLKNQEKITINLEFYTEINHTSKKG